MKMYDIIIESASEMINYQNKDGSMPSGHNGPYHHNETPIRNTCHWLITFLKAHELTGEEKYLEASNKSINYLIKNKTSFNYQMRTDENRDKCNGLIGPAWVMESLLTASKTLKRDDLEKLASEIFSLHLMDRKLALWYIHDSDGKKLSIDGTFNHQLWFASIGSMFDKKKYPHIHDKVLHFVNNLDKNFDIYNDGLIKHQIMRYPINKFGVKRIILRGLELFKKRGVRKKAVGYHQFNLYAFSILKQNYKKLFFWQLEKFKKALNFLETKQYIESLRNNKYGFGYNVAGIEVAFVLQTFKKNSKKLQEYWIKEQLDETYNPEKKLLCRNTLDPITLSARIYEATRLENINIKLEKPKKQEIYLHFGLHKSGTSFLQDAVFPNIKNIEYHYKPTLPDGSCNPFDIIPKNKILVSDEELSKSLPERNHSDRLYFINKLKEQYPNAHIILGLRNYDTWLRSCYVEYIKSGGQKPFKKYKEFYPHYTPDEYKQIITSKWKSIYIYSQEEMKKDTNKIVKEICDFMNVEIPEYSKRPVNVSLKGWKIPFFRNINVIFRGEWLRKKFDSPYWILTYPYRHFKNRKQTVEKTNSKRWRK